MNRIYGNKWTHAALALGLAYLFSSLAFVALIAVPVKAEILIIEDESLAQTESRILATSIVTVTGMVQTEAQTKVANVEVFAASGKSFAEATSTAEGLYTLTLTAGKSYDIIFNPPFGSGLASKAVRGISGTQVLNITLPPGQAISGTVYSNATKMNPVSNVAIFAFNKNTFDGFGLPPTKADGIYQISLEKGPWELTFTPQPFLSLGPTRTVITLTNSDMPNTDIILQPGFTISGQVTSNGTDGIPDVAVFAHNAATGEGYGFSATDASGFFTGTVATGTYDILFTPPPHSGFGAVVITNVTGPPDVFLNVTLPTGHTISGQIRCGSGLANAFVEATPVIPFPGDDINGYGKFASIDGSYALALTPGSYTITVKPPDNSGLSKQTITRTAIAGDLSLDFDHGDCLAGVSINGPTVAMISDTHTFVAQVSPLKAINPITYVWQATEKSPITNPNAGVSNSIPYTWETVGQRLITVSASSLTNTVTSTHVVTIGYIVRLPIILKN